MNSSSLLSALGACLLLAATTRAQAPQTNQPPTVATNAVGTNAVSTNVVAATNALARPPGPRPPGQEGGADGQLSFQNAQVDMVVQWLAKTTGKSVVKHPRVQCQLTIVGSKNLTPREQVNLVYRALSLEGFSAIETSQSILIVPEGSEPKTTPEFVNGQSSALPEGRQRLVRIFELKHLAPADARDKIKTALSEKAGIDLNDRANQLIITDYTDNIRLATELLKELDVESSSDIAVEFFQLKNGEAEEIAAMLGQILNAQINAGAGASSSSSSSSSGSSSRSSGFPPGMPMPMPTPPPSSGGSTPPASAGNPASPIKIWPDRIANQLIVSAPKSKMAEVKELLATLDSEKPQDVSIRVIPLKNVSAEDFVREMAPILQKMTGKSARDRIEVTANTRSNSLIVFSSEANFRALKDLIGGLDDEDAQERKVRAFELKNADAEDVAKQLQDLNQDQGRSTYPFFIFSSSSMGRGDNKKVNVVADRRRNTVIVQAPPSAMGDIEKLVETLDEPVNDDALAPRIYRLKYVSAVDIAEVLNELFIKRPTQQRQYWDPYMEMMSGNNRDRDSSSGKLFGKVRITSEPYSNSIIITSNSAENLRAIEEVLEQLDNPSQAGETTMRVTLNFAKAVTVASSLNILFARGGSPPLRQVQQAQPQPGQQGRQQNTDQTQIAFGLEQEAKEDGYFPWLGGQQEQMFGRDGQQTQRPVSDLVGRVRVVPDRRSNSLLITANLHFFPQIMKLISDLDAPTPQVLIEARIVEVASDFRDKLGVRWAPDGRVFTGEDLENSAMIQTSTMFREVFAGTVGDTSLRSGVLDSSISIDFLVQFLRKNLNGKVLAQPQINVADNEVGKLFVGSRVPFISGSLTTDVGAQNNTFQYRDVGIILEVTPRINSSNEIALRISAESSSIRNGETLFGGAILDTRNFRTDLMVQDGQTVVLGGIIQREQNETIRKTPGLGSVPVLGWAFKKKDKIAREVELMVFLRTRITRSPEQAQALLQEVERKTPLIRAWQDQDPITKTGQAAEAEAQGKKPDDPKN